MRNGLVELESSGARPPVRYVAEFRGAHEVTLAGTADLAFWRARLAEHGFSVRDSSGKARILISSVSARWMGVAFREATISIAIAPPPDEPGSEAFFLVQAFHSSRWFAFCEQAFFRTPYAHAAVRVVAGLPAAIALARADGTTLEARMSSTSVADRVPSRSGEDGWQGPVFLPSGGGRRMYARIGGLTQVYPFSAADAVTLTPGTDDRVVAWLAESRFAGVEWILRPSAAHARSKTVRHGSHGVTPRS